MAHRRRAREPKGRIARCQASSKASKERVMKGIAAWLLGVPIVMIIGLYLFNIF